MQEKQTKTNTQWLYLRGQDRYGWRKAVCDEEEKKKNLFPVGSFKTTNSFYFLEFGVTC